MSDSTNNEPDRASLPCPKSKSGRHEDDGGPFFARCRHCGADLEEPPGESCDYKRLHG